MSRALTPLLLGLALTACQTRPPASERASVRPAAPTGVSNVQLESRPDDRPAQGSPDEFLREAVLAATFEIESSRLALGKDSSGAVRAFAALTIEGREESNRALEALARRREILLPRYLDAEEQGQLEELRRLDGPEFDREYHRCLVSVQDGAIALFERAAQDLEDRGVRKFASRTLPDLRKHRMILGEVQASPVQIASGAPGN